MRAVTVTITPQSFDCRVNSRVVLSERARVKQPCTAHALVYCACAVPGSPSSEVRAGSPQRLSEMAWLFDSGRSHRLLAIIDDHGQALVPF